MAEQKSRRALILAQIVQGGTQSRIEIQAALKAQGHEVDIDAISFAIAGLGRGGHVEWVSGAGVEGSPARYAATERGRARSQGQPLMRRGNEHARTTLMLAVAGDEPLTAQQLADRGGIAECSARAARISALGLLESGWLSLWGKQQGSGQQTNLYVITPEGRKEQARRRLARPA